VALFQQKQQLNMLINITEKLIQEEIMHKYVNNWVNMELPEIPKVGGLKEIVGLYDVKKVLKSSVILPKTQPQLFQSRRICNSILLFGPPGTGKTRLVHALAAEADATFHCITAGNVLSHYVGQTEKYFGKDLQVNKNTQGGNLDNWIPLLHKTDGYSGSDLSDVVQSALNIPLNELEDTKIWKCSNDGFYEPVLGEQDFCNVICSELSDLPSNSVKARQVHMTDLLNAVDHVMRTVSPIDVKKYEHFNGI
ncbi:AAA, RuvB N and/or TIP49 domain containing protein, partial [Asbolus verrucosus]